MIFFHWLFLSLKLKGNSPRNSFYKFRKNSFEDFSENYFGMYSFLHGFFEYLSKVLHNFYIKEISARFSRIVLFRISLKIPPVTIPVHVNFWTFSRDCSRDTFRNSTTMFSLGLLKELLKKLPKRFILKLVHGLFL